MNRISIKNMDGTMEEVDLINAFKITELNKRFVILSKGYVYKCLGYSFYRMMIGFLIAFAVAFVIGIVASISSTFKKILEI